MDRLFAMSVFVKAVDLGSFTATGAELGLSSQVVGKNVRMLEQYLGVQLLLRTTRRQSLTDFGRTFYERARVILAEVENAENIAAETQQVPTGRLRVNAPVSFGMHMLSPRLPEYMRDNPDVVIDLTLSNRAVDLVDEGYDVVFRIGELSDSGLIGRALAPYQLVLCAAPSYLAQSSRIERPEDLTEHSCLGFSHTELRTHWTFEGPGGRTVVPVGARMMADHGEPLRWAALAGLGVMLQPIELVCEDLAQERLVQILPEWAPPDRPMHLLYAPDRRPTPKLRSFIEFAVRLFG